jgi:Zn-dependent protease with chaperone function
VSELFHQLGFALIISWAALPVLACVAAHRAEEPGSRQQSLTLALAFGALLFVSAWIRGLSHEATALCFSSASESPLGLAFGGQELPAAILDLAGAMGLMILVVGAIRTGRAVGDLRRLLREAQRSAPLSERARLLAHELGIGPAPEVVISCFAKTPFVVGRKHPRIVVPRLLSETLAPERLDMVLRHELVHLMRGDPELAFLIVALRIPFALHPVAAWLSREIAVAREQAVDQILATGRCRDYAQLLVDITEAHPAAALCSAAPSSLERRVDRLLEPRLGPRASAGRVALAGTGLIALALLAPPAFPDPHVLSAHGCAPLEESLTPHWCAARIEQVCPLMVDDCECPMKKSASPAHPDA